MEGYLLLAGIAALFIWAAWRGITQEPPPPNQKLACPHCGWIGKVTVTEVDRKQGISGGKATAGLMTGGLSLPLVGLSRKQKMRRLHCGNCGMEWDVA